jgi:hypothetical protein
MTLHDVPLDDVFVAQRNMRSGLATMLRAASRMLDALAARLTAHQASADTEMPVERMLEFHADAAAPEGALYVNGQLVGRLLGVSRL